MLLITVTKELTNKASFSIIHHSDNLTVPGTIFLGSVITCQHVNNGAHRLHKCLLHSAHKIISNDMTKSISDILIQ